MTERSPADLVDQWMTLIQGEKRRLKESLYNIAEYAEKLRDAARKMEREIQ